MIKRVRVRIHTRKRQNIFFVAHRQNNITQNPISMLAALPPRYGACSTKEQGPLYHSGREGLAAVAGKPGTHLFLSKNAALGRLIYFLPPRG